MITITFKANTISDSDTNTNTFELKAEEAILVDWCFDAAWRYGTEIGWNEYSRWFWTNFFYETFCEEQIN